VGGGERDFGRSVEKKHLGNVRRITQPQAVGWQKTPLKKGNKKQRKNKNERRKRVCEGGKWNLVREHPWIRQNGVAGITNPVRSSLEQRNFYQPGERIKLGKVRIEGRR